jgi:hypothetical protein
MQRKTKRSDTRATLAWGRFRLTATISWITPWTLGFAVGGGRGRAAASPVGKEAEPEIDGRVHADSECEPGGGREFFLLTFFNLNFFKNNSSLTKIRRTSPQDPSRD